MPSRVADDFRANVQSVHELVNFDRTVMEFAIEQVERLHNRLVKERLNPAENGEHTLLALKNVRANDSLRRTYQLVANQGIVLLVSYFGAAMGDAFRDGIARATAHSLDREWRTEELKLTVAELLAFKS